MDDRILVNLVLNENTVQAVEGRVRNLINRLNNQNINLNINSQNLDNILNRLNMIQQNLQRLNNTTVDINLNQQQRQYSLETERLRVNQQLEIARQRTLQTENNAIRALAEENRTMTINRNLTADINGNIQHTHEHIRNVNHATNDFAIGLGRSLQHILQYRVITEILNQITEAYRELQSVDSAMVGYRKVTGASKSEVSSLTKEAFSNAAKYGRLASEYAESTEKFAKAGYNNKSSELSETALLAMNVGDIDNELANEFLISSDAAWQLNGDITELTKILDMFNELSNKTATDVSKLASGITVSGSMFAQAGLSAQDYAAIIGTATSKTARSGEEMSRAWRTIIMNLSQIRGTDIETGEIIDEDKLAKAEKTLNAVGIQIREIVNGQNELRNPMQILGEIADKWESLSSIQQSALSESISGKRQSNAFISVIENWKDVEKAIEITANSSNSAIRENEIYLDSWSAKQKQVSAEWSEFISHMSNVEVIKGALDVLSYTINMLDTPIGRIATQIVLLNVALALTGRLWQAVRARSVIADILSIGVAEGNLGGAIQLVNGHLREQLALWASSPAGWITIAVGAVAGSVAIFDALTTSIEEAKEKLSEANQTYEEQKQKVEEINNELTEYEKQLNALGSKTLTPVEEEEYNRLKNVTEELRIQLGIEKELEAIKKKEASDAAVKAINSSKNGWTNQDIIDTARTGYVNTGDEITRILNNDSWNAEQKSAEIERLKEHQRNLQQQALEASQELLNQAKSLDVNDAEAKALYDTIQNLSAQTLEWASAAKTATDSVEENNSVASNAQDSIEALSDKLDKLNTLSEGIELVSSAYKEMADDGIVSIGTITKISESFSDVAGIDGYIDAIIKARSNSEEFTDALTNLTYGCINSTYSTEELANAEVEHIAAMLEAKGVANAEEITMYAIGRAKEEVRVKTEMATASTADAVVALATEAAQAGVTGKALNDLVLNVGIFNNTHLDVADKIAALQELGYYASWSANQIARIASVKRVTQDGIDVIGVYDDQGILIGLENVVEPEIPELPKVDVPQFKSNYTPKDKSSSSSTPDKPTVQKFTPKEYETNDEYSDYWGELLEEKEIELDNFDSEYDKLNAKLDNALAKGNIDEATILYQRLQENRKQKQKLYHEHADMARADLANIMKDLYGIAPEFDSRSIDAIAESEKEAVRQRLEDRILAEKNIAIDLENERDKALVDLENDWEQWAYSYKSGNKNKEDETYKAKETEYKQKKEDLESQDVSNSLGIKSAELMLDKYDALINSAETYGETINGWSSDWLDIENEKLENKSTYLNNLLSETERHTTRIKEDLQEIIDSKNEEIKKENAVLSIMQKQYDMHNALSDAQNKANKAIATSRVSYSYIDNPELLKNIYNEEDYERVSNKINEVASGVDTLTNQFISDINDAYDNDKLYLVESITAEYERQCDLKERELEILQAEIDLQKKQEQLNNVLAEKNVRVLKDGVWQWTYDVDAARQATEELHDAQYQVETLQKQQQQQIALNQQQLRIDGLNNEIGLYENKMEDLDDAAKHLQRAVEDITEPLASVESLVQSFAENGIGKINEAVDDLLVAFSKITNQDYGSISDSVAMKALKQRYGDKASKPLFHLPPAKGYASGTKRTTPGLAKIDEISPETILTRKGAFIDMANFVGGDTIFNPEMRHNLWEQAQLPLDKMINQAPNVSRTQTIDNSQTFNGGITVNNPADFDGFMRDLTAQAESYNAISKNSWHR